MSQLLSVHLRRRDGAWTGRVIIDAPSAGRAWLRACGRVEPLDAVQTFKAALQLAVERAEADARHAVRAVRS